MLRPGGGGRCGWPLGGSRRVGVAQRGVEGEGCGGRLHACGGDIPRWLRPPRSAHLLVTVMCVFPNQIQSSAFKLAVPSESRRWTLAQESRLTGAHQACLAVAGVGSSGGAQLWGVVYMLHSDARNKARWCSPVLHDVLWLSLEAYEPLSNV